MHFKTAGMNDGIINETKVTNPFSPLLEICFLAVLLYAWFKLTLKSVRVNR